MAVSLPPPSAMAASSGLKLMTAQATTTAPLAVGLDVSPLQWPGSGIARYTYELLGALWSRSVGPAVVPIGHRRLADEAMPTRDGGPVPRTLGPRFPSRAAWTFGLLPFWLRRSRLDVFHATSYYAPLASGVPRVVTFHDMSIFICPEAHPRSRVLRGRIVLRRVAAGSAALITPSEAARRDVSHWLDVPLDRIHVVPGAPAEHFRPVPAPVAADVAARYGLEPGYFLALGTVEPRKNLDRAIEAIDRLRARGGSPTLVIAGVIGWKAGATLRRAEELVARGSVKFLGHVPEADLPALMSAASGLVYPSLHEGFGLPIVEAMACGIPVITSHGGATAETAGGAALLVDPLDVEAIGEAMIEVREPDRRARLRAAGLRRAAEFSWSRSAQATVAVYDAVRRAGGAA